MGVERAFNMNLFADIHKFGRYFFGAIKHSILRFCNIYVHISTHDF